MEEFFKVVFFNYLISNGDAHLKNFSLIQSDSGDYRLAPAYDLISTIIHVPGETDMALDLFDGDHNTSYYQTFGHHGYPDFMEFANQIGLIPKRAKRIMTAMIGQKDSVIKMINLSNLPNDIKAIYLKSFLDKLNRIKE
jgi:serine/threonine-protein kinase HipA